MGETCRECGRTHSARGCCFNQNCSIGLLNLMRVQIRIHKESKGDVKKQQG